MSGSTGAPQRADLVRAYDRARADQDVEAMAEAALRLATTQIFGTFPGRVPAFLHEAYSLAAGDLRARLAVQVARAWAYGGVPERAVAYAAEALEYAEAHDDPGLLAQALDAQLLVTWGPDDLEERLHITARLEDVVAALADVEVRLSAHLWRLTTALECLQPHVVRRQVRALELLADESGSARVRFFAASRRAMVAMVEADATTAQEAMQAAIAAGTEAGEPDTYAIEREIAATLARQTRDLEGLAREAATYEAFGVREAVPSIVAGAAVLWLDAGQDDRAEILLHEVAGDDYTGIPLDQDWLLTMTSLAEVAAAVGNEPLAQHALRLLEPYAGRGIANAGGVNFGGVVDHHLALLCRALDRDEEATRWSASASDAYVRMGARWWLDRLGAPPPSNDVLVLRPGADGIWWIGPEASPSPVREMKGLRYLHLLLQRPGVDVAAADLVAAVAGHPGSVVVDQAPMEVADRRALAAYRQRLDEIDAELDEARSWSDGARIPALAAEREALLAELRTAVGLDGRARTAADASERARVAVRKAIVAAVERIATVDPRMARIVTDTVTTGAWCRYDPDPHRPVRWVLSS